MVPAFRPTGCLETDRSATPSPGAQSPEAWIILKCCDPTGLQEQAVLISGFESRQGRDIICALPYQMSERRGSCR